MNILMVEILIFKLAQEYEYENWKTEDGVVFNCLKNISIGVGIMWMEY